MFRSLASRRPYALLTLFCLLLWAPGFFTLPPGDRDESRFAQATKQMLETGDFVRILNGTEARNRKPIGIYWLQAPFVAAAEAAGLARGNPIWPYRIPSALGALTAVLGTAALGRRLFGSEAGLLGAAFLAASVILTAEAHIAKTDAALLGSVVLAMGVLGRAYRGLPIGPGAAALFWLSLAASVLLKGPIGPMIAGLTALTLAVADRRGRWLLALRPGWGMPLLLAAVLPWFVAIGLATHGQFFADAVGGDLGRKLSSGDDAHWGPPGLHLLLIAVLLLPACAALPGAVAVAWRERRDPATRFLLAWIVPSWLVFEATPTKLPHYTLPLYPALCLLAGSWLLRSDRRPVSRWAALAAIVVAALLAVALGVVPPLLHQPAVLGLPAALGAALVAAALVPLLRRPGPARDVRPILAALLCMPFLYWAALGWELPHLRPLWIAPRVAEALPPGRLGAVGFAEPSLMFLAGTQTEWLLPQDAARALGSGEVATLLVGDRDLASVLADLRRRQLATHEVAVVHGYNYSRGRFVALTLLTRDP